MISIILLTKQHNWTTGTVHLCHLLMTLLSVVLYHITSAVQFSPQQNYRMYPLLWGIHFLLGHAKWPPLPDCIQYGSPLAESDLMKYAKIAFRIAQFVVENLVSFFFVKYQQIIVMTHWYSFSKTIKKWYRIDCFVFCLGWIYIRNTVLAHMIYLTDTRVNFPRAINPA